MVEVAETPETVIVVKTNNEIILVTASNSVVNELSIKAHVAEMTAAILAVKIDQ